MLRKTAIMGFGNPVRSDDGIGVYVVERLKEHFADHEQIGIFDMGTSAFEVLFKLKGHQRIIIVDAVINTNEAPGTIYKLPAEEIEGYIEEDPLVFLHSLKWHQALSYAKKILQNEYPNDIQVYLIAVDNIRLDVCLSEVVKEAGDKVVTLIKSSLSLSNGQLPAISAN